MILAAAFAVPAATSDFSPEEVSVHVLPAGPHPDWLWVNDIVFDHIADGRATLIDSASGEYLGMLSTGLMFLSLTIPSHGREIYAAQTYLSRLHRGERSDIVAIYDAKTLSPVAEIPIPPKRGISAPTLWSAALADDDRFMAIFNFTPATTLSIVDVVDRRFLREVEIPGCVLAYPAGVRRFLSLCGDGTLLDTVLDREANVVSRARSARFFDPWVDAVQEDAVRINDTWIFYSDRGVIQPVAVHPDGLRFLEKWQLARDETERRAWSPGGTQALAVHESSRRLYVVMHQGGKDTHDMPGSEIWVYDLGEHKRLNRIITRNPVTSIQVSSSGKPLLSASAPDRPAVDVYDGLSGVFLHTVERLGYSPMILQRH